VLSRCSLQDEAAPALQQLLQALSYCHAANVVHRDVKPQNLILVSTAATEYSCKLVDFGFSTRK